MSKSSYSFLMRCLRFDDRSKRDERRKQDRFAPIKKVLDAFIQHCWENYIPSEHVMVYEQLLAFRGRCISKMYKPKKPAK